MAKKGSFEVKVGLSEMLKGGVKFLLDPHS